MNNDTNKYRVVNTFDSKAQKEIIQETENTEGEYALYQAEGNPPNVYIDENLVEQVFPEYTITTRIKEKAIPNENKEVSNEESIPDLNEIPVKNLEDDMEEFLKRFALIRRGSSTEIFNRNPIDGKFEFSEIKAFHEFHKKHNYLAYEAGKKYPAKVYVSKEWQEHKLAKQYYDIVFDPSGKTPKSYLNLWKGWKVKPMAGDISLFLELVAAICDDHQPSIDYLLDYLAHMVQKPAELPEVVIAMQSDEKGTGKGTLFKTLFSLTDNYKALNKRDDLIGQFTGHLADAFITALDELVWSGNKQDSDILKSLISEQFVTINEKHKSLIQVRNYKRVFIASNNKLFAPVDIGDRRFFVVEVNPRLKHTPGWFKRYNENFLAKDGPSILLNFLMIRDISNFDTRNFPTTRARIDLMKRNLTPVQKFVYELYNSTALLSEGTETKDGNVVKWYRTGLVKDCYDWMKQTSTTYYDQTLKDDISKTLNHIFGFSEIDPKWSHNWKDRTGTFYKLPGTKEEQMKVIATRMFESADPTWIFEEYFDDQKKPETRPTAVVEAVKKPLETNPRPAEIKQEPPRRVEIFQEPPKKKLQPMKLEKRSV
jgi:hypothetical protein